MKTSSIIFAITSVASLVAASPAASNERQVMTRQGIICIGCINTTKNCQKASSPDGCVANVGEDDWDARECDEYCFPAQAGCNCCKRKDGEADHDDCRFNG